MSGAPGGGATPQSRASTKCSTEHIANTEEWNPAAATAQESPVRTYSRILALEDPSYCIVYTGTVAVQTTVDTVNLDSIDAAVGVDQVWGLLPVYTSDVTWKGRSLALARRAGRVRHLWMTTPRSRSTTSPVASQLSAQTLETVAHSDSARAEAGAHA